MAHFPPLASERPERRCLIFHAELLSAHQGGGPSPRTAACRTLTKGEGTDSFGSGSPNMEEGNECEVIHSGRMISGGDGGLSLASSLQMKAGFQNLEIKTWSRRNQ